MSRFEITVPGGRNFTGESAGGAKFRDGVAVIDTTDDAKAVSTLAYFNASGYQVRPLDGESVAEVLASQGAGADRSALTEAAALRREIAELKARRDLDELRKERDDLYREVNGRDRDEDQPQQPTGALSAGTAVDEPAKPTGRAELTPQQGEGAKLAPPQNDAPVSDWRTWAVDSGRASEEEVSGLPRADIIRTHGKQYDAERAAELDGSAGA